MQEGADGRGGRWDRAIWPVVWVAALFLAPLLRVTYLPFTDLPQHLAIVNILAHLDDPALGYADWYTADWGRSYYVLTYLLMLGLHQLLPLGWAAKVTILLSCLTLPWGVASILRARGQPTWLALLCLPLLYNHTLFWGFLGFQMGIGLALVVIGGLMRPRAGAAGELWLGVLVCLMAVCHPYGLALVGGYVVCGLVVRAGVRVWSHGVPLGLVGIWIGAWGLKGNGAMGAAEAARRGPGLVWRWVEAPNLLVGAYVDGAEGLIVVGLIGLGLVAMAASVRRLGLAARELAGEEVALWALVVVNLLLYFAMPEAALSNGLLFFRHLVISAFLAVAATSWAPLRWGRPVMVVGLPLMLCALGLRNDAQLQRFDAEARSFDAVIEAVPPRSRVIGLMFAPNGAFFHHAPYRHFGSYVQIARGGLYGLDFAQQAWQMPLRPRADVARPRLSPDFDLDPRQVQNSTDLGFFDHVIVRSAADASVVRQVFATQPYVVALEDPPWFLLRRIDAGPPRDAPPVAADPGG